MLDVYVCVVKQFFIIFVTIMERAILNYNLIDQESDSSEYIYEMAEFNAIIRKQTIFRQQHNYLALFDKVEFLKRFR